MIKSNALSLWTYPIFLGYLFSALVALADPTPSTNPSNERDAGLNSALKHYGARQTADQHVKATDAFIKLARKYPKDLEIQIWCARTAYYASHRHRDSDSDIMKRLARAGHQCGQRLKRQFPKNYDAQVWAILIRFKYLVADSMLPPLGKIEKVARQLEQLVKQHPQRAKAYMLLGAIYRELPGWPISIGDEDHSLKLLKRGLPYAKKNAEYLLELAATYAALDREDKARATYKEAAQGAGDADLIWERDDARAWARKMLAELND